LPMHAPRLRRENIIETERSLLAATRFDQLSDPPSPAACAERSALILAFILGAPANPTAEARATVDDPAAASAHLLNGERVPLMAVSSRSKIDGR